MCEDASKASLRSVKGAGFYTDTTSVRRLSSAHLVSLLFRPSFRLWFFVVLLTFTPFSHCLPHSFLYAISFSFNPHFQCVMCKTNLTLLRLTSLRDFHLIHSLLKRIACQWCFLYTSPHPNLFFVGLTAVFVFVTDKIRNTDKIRICPRSIEPC